MTGAGNWASSDILYMLQFPADGGVAMQKKESPGGKKTELQSQIIQ